MSNKRKSQGQVIICRERSKGSWAATYLLELFEGSCQEKQDYGNSGKKFRPATHHCRIRKSSVLSLLSTLVHSHWSQQRGNVGVVTISFRPKLENWIFADGTITTGGNNSVETTWQRERKLVTIPWYTEIYFEWACTDVKDKTIFGSTVLLF